MLGAGDGVVVRGERTRQGVVISRLPGEVDGGLRQRLPRRGRLDERLGDREPRHQPRLQSRVRAALGLHRRQGLGQQLGLRAVEQPHLEPAEPRREPQRGPGHQLGVAASLGSGEQVREGLASPGQRQHQRGLAEPEQEALAEVGVLRSEDGQQVVVGLHGLLPRLRVRQAVGPGGAGLDHVAGVDHADRLPPVVGEPGQGRVVVRRWRQRGREGGVQLSAARGGQCLGDALADQVVGEPPAGPVLDEQTSLGRGVAGGDDVRKR